MSGTPADFADTLRQVRVAAGLTQQQLAGRSGVSERSISDLERGVNERPRRDSARMLADGLGLDAAERQAFLEAARRRPRAATAPRVGAGLSSLPPVSTPLLGREPQLRYIEDALAAQQVRLLTLTGPGGVGKTRLALEVARRMAERTPQEVIFLRLDGVQEPSLVLPTLAAALLLQDGGEGQSIAERIAYHLMGRQTLVILDNLEHLLSATPDIAELLAIVPPGMFLATSRESLRIADEQVVPIAPLPLPGATWWQSPEQATDGDVPLAVQLFVQRALAQRPDLEVDPLTEGGRVNLAAITEICHRLDGLPLAIELAAAQTQALSPRAILVLLKQAGLPLLAGGNRDKPTRLQTMDSAIAWSYNLLDEGEQALLRVLSVFMGGFTLEAAAAVLGPTASMPGAALVGAIASLARGNLLVQERSGEDGGEPRFRLLEPLRLFALDRLKAAEGETAARLRHARYFAAEAERLDALTLGPDPEVWLEHQARDLDNFRAAQDWTLAAGEHALAAHIAGYTAQFFLFRGLLKEGRQRIASAIHGDVGASPADRWFLHFWATIFAIEEGDVTAAKRHAEAVLAIAEMAGDPVGVGAGLSVLSLVAGTEPGGHEEARDLACRAVDVLEPLGRGEWTGTAWARLGIEHQRLGMLEEAKGYLQRCFEIRRAIRCEGCQAYSLAMLGSVSFDLAEPDAALDAFRRCLELTIKQGNIRLIVAALVGLADVAWRFGAGPDAAGAALRLFGASEALRARHGIGWDPAGAEAARRWQTPIREALGNELADQHIAEGMALAPVEAAALASRLTVAAGRQNAAAAVVSSSLFAALGSIE
jgi:predicted ATPase/DNA-binding XRE family transcriptional regulator